MIELQEAVATAPRVRDANLRTLLIGAGNAGRAMARALHRVPAYGLTPVGFLDDKPGRRVAAGLPVFGRIDDLADVAAANGIDVVVVTIPSLGSRRIAEIAARAHAIGLLVRFLPSFVAALERDLRVSDLRTVRIDTLLGRCELRVIRTSSSSVISGRRVMVTGAGGSIGSELCRQIDTFDPSALYMVDHDESNLHRLQLDLRGHGLLDSDDIIIADVRDRSRMRQLFQTLKPEVVFHAAAHKHLPLLERHPCEGVKSNVAGTQNLIECAIAAKTERFILISTDKAADPTSVLGATKRLAEMVVRNYAGMGTMVASVRFGNVLGSRGSLLSVLQSQIERGEELTITDPEVTRFFMTVEEAVGLVLEAAVMASDGEVFVLDMGEPVRILDLVRNYTEQMHLDLDAMHIRFTGLRPGEKLDETLTSGDEERMATAHPKIWNTRTRTELPVSFARLLQRLYSASARNDVLEVRRRLATLVPAYHPSAGDTNASAAPYPDDW